MGLGGFHQFKTDSEARIDFPCLEIISGPPEYLFKPVIGQV